VAGTQGTSKGIEIFILQFKYEQPRLTLSHPRRLSLSYQRITFWDAVTKLVRPSKSYSFSCKNGIRDLMRSAVITP